MKEKFGLYLILTDPVAGYEACAQAAVECGVRYLQLRMKKASETEQLETAKAIRTITAGSRTRFILNDDVALAKAVDADGVHLGQDDLTIEAARSCWNSPGKLFGLSTHSMEQARQAQAVNPDYIGVGPVFATATKPDAAPALGAAETARIIGNTPLTAVAIGGINRTNLPDLVQVGLSNFCVVSAVNARSNPAQAIRELQQVSKSNAF